MKHFPVFLAVAHRRIVLSGGGAAALAKLRLLLTTEARITVLAPCPAPEIEDWARAGRLTLIRRAMQPGDALCALLFYAATDDAAEDARVARLARADGALVNRVDNLEGSQFITPAIVDRAPVTVAIGTAGAAPVLARANKADLKARLSPRLSLLARIGKGFRQAAEALPTGRARREFWSNCSCGAGPQLADRAAPDEIATPLEDLLARHPSAGMPPGRVDFVGAGPGDPDLLTLMARKLLDRADVVIHDRLVSPGILELGRREAKLIAVGKEGFGPSVGQNEINRLIVHHAAQGAHVVRLKGGDPSVFGRLDEELEAVTAAGIEYGIVPGITAASAAAAQIGQSLTARSRNSEVRLVTGHDLNGYADQDWRALARPGTVAAIYMAKKASRFLQGRLIMFGADPDTAVSLVENVSRPEARVHVARLGSLAEDMAAAAPTGPVLILLGLAPREAHSALPALALEHA